MYINGLIVHYRDDSNCKPVLVLEDDGTGEYGVVVTGVELRTGLLGILDSTPRNGLTRNGDDIGADGHFHYQQECPYV